MAIFAKCTLSYKSVFVAAKTNFAAAKQQKKKRLVVLQRPKMVDCFAAEKPTLHLKNRLKGLTSQIAFVAANLLQGLQLQKQEAMSSLQCWFCYHRNASPVLAACKSKSLQNTHLRLRVCVCVCVCVCVSVCVLPQTCTLQRQKLWPQLSDSASDCQW